MKKRKKLSPPTEFEKRLWLSSVALARLDPVNKLPTGIASGALIDYCGKRLLLTVWHATKDQELWAVQVRYDPDKGTLNYPIPALNYLATGYISKRPKKLTPIDFAYTVIPPDVRPLWQEIEFPNSIRSEAPVTIHTPTLTDEPYPGESYGFSGLVLPTVEEHPGKNLVIVERQVRTVSGLSYLRTENGFHHFLLPFRHPGHKYFKGCSGAPVLSEKGAFVGLVCGGKRKTNEVRVIPIRQQKTPIDIIVGNI